MLEGKRPETLGFSDSSLCAGNQSPICGLFVVDIYYKAKINMLTIYNMVKWIWLIVFPDRIHQVIRNVFFNKAKIANISVCNQVIKFTTISEIRYQCMLKEVAAFLEKHSATLSLYISLTFTYPTSPSASFISAKSTGLFILLCLFICTFSHNIPYVWNNLSLVSAKFTLY